MSIAHLQNVKSLQPFSLPGEGKVMVFSGWNADQNHMMFGTNIKVIIENACILLPLRI